MRQITKILNQANQKFKFAVPGYDSVEITLQFKPNQDAWFISLVWGSFQVLNDRVVNSLNLLRQYKNMIPFGILIYHPDRLDPFSLEAWTSGFEFYMLDSADIALTEAYYV